MMEQTISYKIIGMTCMLCSSEIENKIKKLKGIKNVDVNYSTETAIVVHDKEMCSSDEIRNCITSLGFYIDDEQGKGSAKYIQNLKNKVILSFIFTVPLMIAMLLCNVESCCVIIDPNYESSVAQITAILRYKLYFLHSWKVQMILAAIVQFILGRKFYKNALASILNRKLGMDLLVSLGSISTFAYSIYCVYKNNGEFGNQLYFESGAMMISFILLGKYLEALAKRRTNNTLNSLKKMQDNKVIVEISNGDIEKDVKNIKVDDVIIITPGQQIPLDGIIIEGESSIDESLITGESMAVLKKVGDKVFGGTINTYGSFKFKVERTIDEGLLSNIISFVEEAQKAQPKIQKLADKICSIFVPAVITISLVTFLYWFLYRYHGSFYYIEKPIINAVCVLVISCPCALGIATPIAVTLGMGLAAKSGILIKRGDVFEESSKIDTIIFDKTGTITENKLKVKEIINFTENYTKESLLEIISSVERYSEHPIGKAIYEKGKRINLNKINIQNFRAHVGKGVTALIENKKIIIGNAKMLEENGIEVKEIKNKIAVYIAIDRQLVGAVSFEDTIKEDAEKAVKVLKKRGMYTMLVSGDKKDVCNNVGKKIGVDKVYSEVTPQDKYKIIKDLQKDGKKVAMIGDGINDSIALSAADLSISLKEGTDIAVESSDVIIMRKSLLQIPLMLQISKKTIVKIKQNLLFAFIYNIVGIPIAASGMLKPEIACILMTISSLSVVLNTLTLKKLKKEVY